MKNFVLVKLDRLTAWVLFACMLAYFITGYGMTKGIIDAGLATNLHNSYLIWIIFISFVVHSFLAIRLAFIRWKILNPYTSIVLGLIYLSIIFGFVYFQVFYKKEPIQTTQPVEVKSSNQLTSTTETKDRVFSSSELSKYNGLNGQKAYVAVEGIVYDVTNLFQNGTHFGHKAGEELTNAFLGRHVVSQISKYPVVGTFSK